MSVDTAWYTLDPAESGGYFPRALPVETESGPAVLVVPAGAPPDRVRLPREIGGGEALVVGSEPAVRCPRCDRDVRRLELDSERVRWVYLCPKDGCLWCGR